MRLTAWPLLAIVSLLPRAAPAATRPHYGGTLRVQMKARVASLDSSAEDNLSALAFDRLVGYSESALPQPALAIGWRHDPDFKRWEFQLRPGVRFSDGAPLTASIAAAALESLGALAQGDTIVIRSAQPAPNLLYILARSAISRRAPDGSLLGTGPFRVTTWEPGRRAIFAANEDYWAGRPYLDGIEIGMGRTLRDQALDLDLNKADVIELGFGDARRGAQNGKRAWISPPVELLAIVFDSSVDEQVREAVALSIDRPTIHNVLLQKQGAPAGSILPQWLSGYAFLFPTVRDLDRARQLARGAPPVPLAYDPADPTARLIAERVALNAHEAGLVIRPAALGAQAAGARLVRTRIASPDPAHALVAVSPFTTLQSPSALSAEALYEEERALLRGYRIVPLFHLPEIFGLGPRVRGWAPSRWGAWKLDSVWLAP